MIAKILNTALCLSKNGTYIVVFHACAGEQKLLEFLRMMATLKSGHDDDDGQACEHQCLQLLVGEGRKREHVYTLHPMGITLLEMKW